MKTPDDVNDVVLGRRSGVFIVNVKQISHLFLGFLFLILNK